MNQGFNEGLVSTIGPSRGHDMIVQMVVTNNRYRWLMWCYVRLGYRSGPDLQDHLYSSYVLEVGSS